MMMMMMRMSSEVMRETRDINITVLRSVVTVI